MGSFKEIFYTKNQRRNKLGNGKMCSGHTVCLVSGTHIDIVTQVGVRGLSAVHVELVHFVSQTGYFCSGVASSDKVRDQILQVVGEVFNNFISRCTNIVSKNQQCILKYLRPIILSMIILDHNKKRSLFDISFKLSTKIGMTMAI